MPSGVMAADIPEAVPQTRTATARLHAPVVMRDIQEVGTDTQAVRMSEAAIIPVELALAVVTPARRAVALTFLLLLPCRRHLLRHHLLRPGITNN